MEDIINKVLNHPHFLRLKEVTQNNSYHPNHERVYDHCVKTFEHAKDTLSGDFLIDQKAKDSFNSFLDEEVSGFKKRDLLSLACLVHDIGKLMSFKEDGNVQSTKLTLPTGDEQFPGHGYHGALILEDLLSNIGLTEQVIEFLAKCTLLHNTYNETYLRQRESWPEEILLSDVKASAQELYREILFIDYNDCFEAPTYQDAKKMIEVLFNNPNLYTKREYFFEN